MQFKDGGKITAGFAKEVHCGAFLGDFFILKGNGIAAFYLPILLLLIGIRVFYTYNINYLKKYIKDKNEIENIFVNLTLPEQKSFFTDEELDWIEIVIEAKQKVVPTDIKNITLKLLRIVLRLMEQYMEIKKCLLLV